MNQFGIRLWAIGMDAVLTERIKSAAKRIRPRPYISFIADSNAVNLPTGKVDGIFIYSPLQFGKTLRQLQTLMFDYPGVPIILLSPRNDAYQLVNFFRAGVFDVLLSPVDELEMSQAIHRIRHRKDLPLKGEGWNPLKAMLHFFSQPRAFEDSTDVAHALMQYSKLFLKIEEQCQLTGKQEILNFIHRHHKVDARQEKRFLQFCLDPQGVMFGLKRSEQFLVLVLKFGEDRFFYLRGEQQNLAAEEIFNSYFRNLLKGVVDYFKAQVREEEMQRLALTDEITGLYNQRKLTQDLDYHVTQWDAAKRRFSLMFIDIDYFKTVNDRFGHVIGSQLLIDMAAVLRRELRGADCIYRYGGDEFIVLLPDTGVEEAKKTALRVSQAVKDQEFTVDGGTRYNMSLSVGIAQYPDDAKDAKAMIEFADKMMYMSKKSGRGKVFHVTEVL